MIFRLSELVERHDPALHQHLENEGLQYVQFAFRYVLVGVRTGVESQGRGWS